MISFFNAEKLNVCKIKIENIHMRTGKDIAD